MSVGIAVTGLTSMGQVSLQLVDRGSDEAGRTVPLDFDDEHVGIIPVFELDTSIYEMAASEPVFVVNRTGLQVRDMPQEVTDCMQSVKAQSFF